MLLLGEQHARQLDPSAKIVMVELPTRAVGDVSARAGRCVCAVQEGAICKRAGAMPTWCPSRPRNSRNGTIHTRRRRRQRKFGCCRQFLNFRNELLNLHDFTSHFRNELLTPQRAISNAPNFTVFCYYGIAPVRSETRLPCSVESRESECGRARLPAHSTH